MSKNLLSITLPLLIVVFTAFIFACRYAANDPTLFTLQNNASIGINFSNLLSEKSKTNVFVFRNYYNGAGVAIGDLNNDGLNDIFLASNENENQLLINKGNWKFENVALKAGVQGAKNWSTGVTMVDINADGWLDIYVCQSGNLPGIQRENLLYINQRNGTFTQEAQKYGLADRGLSTQSVFFDYDLDGDLDCFILNNSFRPIGSFDFSQNLRAVVDDLGGARLYRNDNQYFTNVTQQAGIFSSDIGFGLGVAVADVDQDGYPDIYVSNDFFERDYLYINQKNGTFKEDIQNQMGHLSLASMGSDVADVNNDALPDIFTTEMLPEGDKRLKQMTAFESYDVIKLKQKDGYFNQYMQNCLQVNNGDNTFAETANYSGVDATDWSWGALIFDMNNDGWKDIFVANGIYKDLTDQDYIEFLGNRDNMTKIAEKKKFDYKDFTDKMISTPLSNYSFLNNRNLTFTNQATQFGLDKPSYSNGAAYADLDNDGDNDLVVNNVNMPVFVYKNNAEKLNNNYLQVKLKGFGLNTFGIGTMLKAYIKGMPVVYYNQPTRGFQSGVSPNNINMGLGKCKVVDSLQIIWPNGKYQILKNVKANKTYTYQQQNASLIYKFGKKRKKQILKKVTNLLFDSIPKHVEDDFIDFDNERLLLQMLSTENPYLAKADVNNDGLTDFYFGSSKGKSAAIYIQQKNGKFKQNIPPDFKSQIYLENAGAVFGDFDGDKDQDLIIAVGGNADEAQTPVYFPRFFENDGKGNFKRNVQKTIRAAINASVITAADYDKDGQIDLFIGGRSVPGLYGAFPKSYVFHNNGDGNFTDVSQKILGSNTHIGMVTAAQWVDLDKNGSMDLVVVGNWTGIKIFKNNHTKFTEETTLNSYKGWWSSLAIADVNQDGNLDIIAGNLGLNSKFKASEKQPIKIYIKDFDNNGTAECVTSVYKSDHQNYVWHTKPDLVGQLPFFKKQFLKYKDYAGKPFEEIFTPTLLAGAQIHEINYLASAVFLSNGKNNFTCHPFPLQAQLSSVNTILCDDIFNNGSTQIILGGNFYGFKPELGRLDASHGQVYTFTNKGFINIPPLQSGINFNGEVKSSTIIKNFNGKKYYLFGINNQPMQAYQKQ